MAVAGSIRFLKDNKNNIFIQDLDTRYRLLTETDLKMIYHEARLANRSRWVNSRKGRKH